VSFILAQFRKSGRDVSKGFRSLRNSIENTAVREGDLDTWEFGKGARVAN